MLRFICLGSGSNGNSYFLFTDSYGIMIDAGIGIRTLKKRFQSAGLELDRINAILITHDHADHIKSVGTLSNDYSLPVYATEDVHKGIGRNFCVSPKLKPELTHYIFKNRSFALNDFQITPFHVPHDSSDNVGYSIKHGETTFCLITDAGHVTGEFGSFIAASDYLVLEANHDENMLRQGPYPPYLKERIMGPYGHLSNKTAAELLCANLTPRLRHVWLCHLSEENNHPDLARYTVEACLQASGCKRGQGLRLDVLRRHSSSEIYDLED